MKFTTRGHYSVKALLDLVIYGGQGPIPIRQISQRCNIPHQYLEQLLVQLRRQGLVKATRGTAGGYELALAPRQISVGQIFKAVGEAVEPLTHLEKDPQRSEDWVTQALWQRLHSRLLDALDQITLEDLYYDARSYQASQGEESSFIV
jgi:Rrf2 family transcriptional regulator, iron-sulfur cluster assembly transcription factor